MDRLLIFLTFLLLFLHQHLSNSAFGINNPFFSICLFLFFLTLLFYQVIIDIKSSYIKTILVILSLISVLLWFINPNNYKDISFIFLNLLVTFYVVKKVGLVLINRQLKFLALGSFFIGLLQISGVFTIVHFWNSQFLQDFSGFFFREIELQSFCEIKTNEYFDFDSRQVRAPGLFHSSALVSGIYVLYTAYVFIRMKVNSNVSLIAIPFISVFSGSKLVMGLLLIIILVSILFNRMGFKNFLTLLFSFILAIYLHKWVFPNLFDYQFNLDILFYSIDLRLIQFAMEPEKLISTLIKIGFLVPILGVVVYFLKNKVGFIKNIDWFNILILVFTLIAYYITTPHIANLMFGWYFLSSIIFYRKKLSKIS